MDGALSLKRNLKAIDQLPHNGIMNDMIKLTHSKRKAGLGAQSNSAAPQSEYPSATALHMGTVGGGFNSNSNSL